MIEWIAFGLSVFNFLWIITFSYFIQKLFRKLQPLLNSFSYYLQPATISARVDGDELNSPS